MIKKITELNLENKTVLLRTDYNVPLNKEKVDKYNTWRIDTTFETINYLVSKNSKMVIICHLGRPEGRVVEEFRLTPIAKYLSKALKRELFVYRSKNNPYVKEIGPLAETLYFLPRKKRTSSPSYFLPRKRGASGPENMQNGDILMLENVRFHPEEQETSPVFAKKLASIGDVFINEAFATAHRNDTSITLLPKILPSAAGFLFEKEIEVLGSIKKKNKKPLIFIMGGAKAKTKAELIKIFLPKVDEVLVGGVLANTVLAAKGIAVGKSIVDSEIAQLLNDIEITNTKLHLPLDVITSQAKDGKKPIFIRPVGNIASNNMILDIGPDTVSLFSAIIEKANTIVWNGPMGYTETKRFSRGTEAILRAVIKNKKAKVIIGGGESISLAAKHNLLKKIDFVSTGGGAMLMFLADEVLPGIEALKK
ncbi:MAG: phosphoglycerate kinase [Candidatus Paceibacterota bacterium]|jgi:phosphoglycerate kinase